METSPHLGFLELLYLSLAPGWGWPSSMEQGYGAHACEGRPLVRAQQRRNMAGTEQKGYQALCRVFDTMESSHSPQRWWDYIFI